MPYINWHNFNDCSTSFLVFREQLIKNLCDLRFLNIYEEENTKIEEALRKLNNLPTFVIDINHRAPIEVFIDTTSSTYFDHLKIVLCAIMFWEYKTKEESITFRDAIQKFLTVISNNTSPGVFGRKTFEDLYDLQWLMMLKALNYQIKTKFTGKLRFTCNLCPVTLDMYYVIV